MKTSHLTPSTITDVQLVAMTDKQLSLFAERFRAAATVAASIGSMSLWRDLSKLGDRRKKALLAAQAARLKSPLYIIEPHEHGNGGWCGSGVLAIVDESEVFGVDPVKDYLDGEYSPLWNSKIRAARTDDPNKLLLYVWDHEARHWLDAKGNPLTGAAKEHYDAQRAKRLAKERTIYKQISLKLNKALTKSERKMVRVHV